MTTITATNENTSTHTLLEHDKQPKGQIRTEKSMTEDEKNSEGEDEQYQDVVSQFPFLNGYSHILIGFQFSEEEQSRDAIVKSLEGAIRSVIQHVPWLGGQMLETPSKTPGASSVCLPAPWPDDATPLQMLRVKHCDDVLPPMAQILRAGTPISMLKADVLTPWPSLPLPHNLDPPLPVLSMQANFVKGGLILNFSPHHVAMDGPGFVQFLRFLCYALRGSEPTPLELEQANRDRSRVLPLIPRGEPVKDHSYLHAPTDWAPKPIASTPKWCYFRMPVSVLPALRKAAAAPREMAGGGSAQLVSDNDILCALCWQRISAVRLARGYAPDTPVKFTRAIDGRAAVVVPASYMGHMTFHSIAQLSLGRAASAPLHSLTQTLRRSLNAANNGWTLRSYATYIAHQQDKSRLIYGGLRDNNLDLGSTSFIASAADEKDMSSVMPEDFGPLLGRARFLRRPDVNPITSTILISPTESGALPVCICLPQDDLEGLKKDKEWRKYTRYVG